MADKDKNFSDDFATGDKLEQEILRLLGTGKVGSGFKERHLGDIYWEDCIIECKNDERSAQTGNICLEVLDIRKDGTSPKVTGIAKHACQETTTIMIHLCPANNRRDNTLFIYRPIDAMHWVAQQLKGVKKSYSVKMWDNQTTGFTGGVVKRIPEFNFTSLTFGSEGLGRSELVAALEAESEPSPTLSEESAVKWAQRVMSKGAKINQRIFQHPWKVKGQR